MHKLGVILLLSMRALVWADGEGPNIADSTAGGTNWTNPDNIRAGDMNCAIYNNTAQDILTAHDFDFSNVTGVIDSIKVDLLGYGTNKTASNREFSVALSKDAGSTIAGNWQTDKQLTEAACATSSTITVTDADWGTTWSPPDVTNTQFGVMLKDDDTTANEIGFDRVQVTVYYTPSGGARRRHIIVGGR